MFVGVTESSHPSEKPNIIIILADDLVRLLHKYGACSPPENFDLGSADPRGIPMVADLLQKLMNSIWENFADN